MKELHNGKIEFITPTFLAGANQNSPEVRVSAMRGELRWWFRALGGTREEESDVFGCVSGETKTSAVLIRASDIERRFRKEISPSSESDKGYLYYFAQVSGNKQGVHRTARGNYFAPGTKFRLSVFLRRNIGKVLEEKLKQALDMFISVGSLGLRATRGCGAMATDEFVTRDEFQDLCQEAGDDFVIRLANEDTYTSGEKCQTALGSFLRSLRKDNHLSGKMRSALGYSDGHERASSALRLRPVKIGAEFLPVVIYTDAACNQPSLKELIVSETISL